MRRLALVSLFGASCAIALLAACSAVLGPLSERADDVTSDPDANADGAAPSPDATSPSPPADARVEGDGGAPGDAACVPEAIALTCAGKACGPATDSCGVPITCPDTCKDGLACGSGGPNACGPASCVGGGDGVSNCGEGDAGSCCESPLIVGGTYFRNPPSTNPATVATFRLDKYEVTVGRFRKFVAASLAGYRPPPASGRHTHLGGGGLNSGEEVGWNALAWNDFIPKNSVKWAESLSGGDTTWTEAPGPNEKKPQNKASWYQLYAFCIWDGGFLPSDAEWQYVASAGGTRSYPWGNDQPTANADRAAYACYFNGTGTCTGNASIAPVDAIPGGKGSAGHHHLAGNVFEWVLDAPTIAGGTCNNCASLPSGTPVQRHMRGASYNSCCGGFLLTTARDVEGAASSLGYTGARCARKP